MKSLLIRPRIYGFFSSMFQVLDNLRYCEINGYKPIIRYDRTSLYNNDSDNVWGEFFENINDDIIEGELTDVYSLPNQKALFFYANFLMMNPLADDFRLKIWTLQHVDSVCFEHRNEINRWVNGYIKPKKEIIQEVDKIKSDWSKTLAIHVRGTDYRASNQFDYLSILVAETEKNMKIHNYHKVFVASDNFEAITRFQKEFGNILFYDTNLRADSFSSFHPICHIVKGEDKIKQGKDVLIEATLLSKCHRIICVNSNVAAYACYKNPNLEINLIRNLHGGG